MATFAFRSAVALHPERAFPVAGLPPRKETLAIVSSSSKLCGIAAYTAALRRQLGDIFDITVFNLNQAIISLTDRRDWSIFGLKEIGYANPRVAERPSLPR